jgi:hypothetical protein
MWNLECGMRNELARRADGEIRRNVEFEMKDWGAQTNSTFLIPNSTLKL